MEGHHIMKNMLIVIVLTSIFAVGSGCTHKDALPPLLMVNDVMYQSYTDNPNIAQELADSWNYIGKVESCVGLTELPRINFQANHKIVGAEIYHSFEGRIEVHNYDRNSQGDRKEFFGDSVIVTYNGLYFQYLALEEVERVNELQRN